MSNNFTMGVGGNSAITKNSTDGILNLLQLSLLGNNGGVAATIAPTSNITSIVPNSNNIMATKANFYPQSVGANLSGLGVGNIAAGVIQQQPIIQQTVSATIIIHQKKTSICIGNNKKREKICSLRLFF